MPADLQIVCAQELVELTRVRDLPGASPRTLEITGRDFRAIEEVLVAGIPSPEFVVVNPTRLLATVPPSLGRGPVSSVRVVSRRLSLGKRSTLRFRMGPTSSAVRGLLRLVQRFLRLLFTTPGRDIFQPALGGAALRNIGLTFGKSEGGSIVSDFIVAVASTERQIIALDGADPSLPAAERLLSARVASAGFHRAEAALVVELELSSHAGEAALAEVAL
jgi:hypothetical protein